MKKKILFASLGLVLALVAGAAFLVLRPPTNEKLLFPVDRIYAKSLGQPMQFEFTALDGTHVSAADLRGKVVLVDFWATWCGPCMQALPEVKNVYDRFHKDGLEIVGVSFDMDKAQLEAVLKDKGIPWPQHFDGAGYDNKIGKQFGINHWPSAWLVDKSGHVRYISALADTDRKVAELLKESEADAAKAKGGVLQQARAFLLKLIPKGGAKGASVAKDAKAPMLVVAPKEISEIKVHGIVHSARPGAVLFVEGHEQSVVVGDEFSVSTTEGRVEVKCEKIVDESVWLVLPGGKVRVELRMPGFEKDGAQPSKLVTSAR